jgi:phage major head subunit gpT-like protein
MVGPKNIDLAMEITKSSERLQLVTAAGVLDPTGSGVAAAAVPNVYAGGDMQVVLNPRLVGDYDDYCYYLDTTKGAKPIGGFVMRDVEAHEQTDMNADARFSKDEFLFSIEADLVFGAGAWQVAHAIIL